MSERLVFLDTEGTGMAGADRIIEIGLVEVIDNRLTGNRFSTLVHTDQQIHWGAQRVHGIKAADLVGKPSFAKIAPAVLDFIGSSRAFAHNAAYDGKMLNKEWEEMRLPQEHRPKVQCTLPIARNVVGGRVGIDALMAHYFPDMPPRGAHSAADDAEILAKIFLRMRADKPAVVNRLLDGWAHTPPKTSADRSQGRAPTSRDAALPRTLNPGVAELIARANADGTLEAAMKIRVGRDYITRMSPEEVCTRAGIQSVTLAHALGQPSETLSALRMIVRGLKPELAVARQMEYRRRSALQADKSDAPSDLIY